MESKVFLLVLNIVIFSCLIESGFALKCYQCDSLSTPKCSDLSDKAIQPQECVLGNVLNQATQFVNNLGFGGNSNSANSNSAVSCLKIVTHNSTHNVVVRQCTVLTDPCTAGQQIGQQVGLKANNLPIDFCGSCTGEACNSANSITLFASMIVFGTMISVARMFA